jgi:DNA-binding LytR/AlgR family response regulator
MVIGICDDNTNELERLKEQCENAGYTDICTFTSADEFLEMEDKPGLLFLDIEMKGMSGIDLKDFLELSGIQTYIVFYTAHSEWMPEAFGRNVIGFLRKPVISREVQRCINKAIFLRKEYCIINLDQTRLYCGQILYIQANGVYTTFICEDDKKYSVRKPLRSWEDELRDFGFCCPHRSYVVNFQHVESIDANYVTLKNGISLPISRRHAKKTRDAYKDYCLTKLA